MMNVETLKEEALKRLENLPANWTNIRATIKTAIKHEEVHYQGYMPIGEAGNYIGRYNRIWDNLGEYAKKVGIKLRYVPCPRGGRWTSKWVFEGLIQGGEKNAD